MHPSLHPSIRSDLTYTHPHCTYPAFYSYIHATKPVWDAPRTPSSPSISQLITPSVSPSVLGLHASCVLYYVYSVYIYVHTCTHAYSNSRRRRQIEHINTGARGGQISFHEMQRIPPPPSLMRGKCASLACGDVLYIVFVR